MSDLPTPAFPLLEIVGFVDLYTAIVAGAHADQLQQGDELYILGQGRSMIPKINVPLVAPKVRVIVTFPAGAYALARTPVKNTAGGLTELAKSFQAFSLPTREPLTEDEKAVLGDPGRLPVKVGDPVIRVSDLGAYIRHLQTSTQSK